MVRKKPSVVLSRNPVGCVCPGFDKGSFKQYFIDRPQLLEINDPCTCCFDWLNWLNDYRLRSQGDNTFQYCLSICQSLLSRLKYRSKTFMMTMHGYGQSCLSLLNYGYLKPAVLSLCQVTVCNKHTYTLHRKKVTFNLSICPDVHGSLTRGH